MFNYILRSFFVYSIPLMFLSSGVGTAAASPYFPQHPVKIETQLFSEANNTTISTSVYHVAVSNDMHAEKELVFFKNRLADGKSLCRIKLNHDGTLSLKKTSKSKYVPILSDVYLLPGFPLPIDILPVESQKDSIAIHQVKTLSGQRTFLSTVTVSIEEVTVDDIDHKLWLKISLPSNTKLLIYTAKNSKNNILSTQVWPESGDWWIYEETPFRRSWLLP